ncbi:disintegrin and metalloproteinase domain-containing protein 9-like [Rhineura floridana]|uniref:disintegrin and metalloproteinase domain-containing protein 9-like n=1 Tax=Rhineura floridana TaxID=261503 RepID=UPI002AC8940A|nr:disintegrin and metalloproteinase domain-containing protein 9-like [Rhineura floridana]
MNATDPQFKLAAYSNLALALDPFLKFNSRHSKPRGSFRPTRWFDNECVAAKKNLRRIYLTYRSNNSNYLPTEYYIAKRFYKFRLVDCYYSGYVEGAPDSDAILSTCSGLWIVGENNSFGKSRGERFCLQNHVSVSSVKISSSLTNDGVSAAHQLGHTVFGFVHDDILGHRGRMCDCNCTSDPGHCIMYSTAVGCHRLSNCSKNAYYEFVSNRGKVCLLNLPKDTFEVLHEDAFEMKICGNGVVEGDEECDCGRAEECQKNDCCQKDCKRKPNTECDYGLCCDKCKIIHEGKVCREAATECDLPEYCNGASASCPPDVYKQNGMPCGTSDNCYLGKCLNLHRHCTDLFGKDAKPAPLSCYKEVNMRGDRTGNCGKDKYGYKKCKDEDVLCGRIQCTDIKAIPRFSTGQAILQTPMDNVLCWGTEFHKGDEANDAGAIEDGSACGANKICIHRACVDLKVLSYDCNFTKCNHQGVCNNNKNCHCTYGWAPPHCTERGFGGSIDSGPAPEHVKSKKTLMLSSVLGMALLVLAAGITFRNYILNWCGRLIRDGTSPKPIDSVSESTEHLSDEEDQSD